MLDIKLIREQPEHVKERIVARGDDPVIIDQILAADAARRTLLNEVEALKAAKNAASKAIGKLKDPAERQQAIAAMRAGDDRIPELDRQTAAVEAEFERLMLLAPNLPHPSVPVGTSEHDNIVARTEGTPRAFDFTPKPHWKLGEQLGIIDFERGVKLSGTRFFVLKGAGSRLQRALVAGCLTCTRCSMATPRLRHRMSSRRQCWLALATCRSLARISSACRRPI